MAVERWIVHALMKIGKVIKNIKKAALRAAFLFMLLLDVNHYLFHHISD